MNEATKVYNGNSNNCCDEKTGEVIKMPSRSVIAGDNEDKNTIEKNNGYRGLDFTECCLRESLRKYSVVPTVVRNVHEDTIINDYYFKKGTKIMVNMQGAHHTKENWPSPSLYLPHRFGTDNIDNIKPYTFLPFIDGPRNCLGQFLSLLESKCILTLLLKKYRFELTNVEDAGKKHSFMVPIIPGEGHYFRVYDR